MDPADEDSNLDLLFDVIRERVPAPTGDPDAPLQMQVTSLDYDDYIGRIVTGKIENGRIRAGETVALIDRDGKVRKGKVTKLLGYAGLQQVEIPEATAGDIVTVAGFEDIGIGETISDANNPQALEALLIDEPTLSMNFMVNGSPFAGKEGKFVTSRQIRERLMRELRTNVSLRVEETSNTDSFKVSGRGELHLSILIENMRREGFELAVSKPEVIFREIDGVHSEPMEFLTVDVPEEYQGTVIEKLGTRKGEMVSMTPMDGVVRIEFIIPARGLIGFRTEFLTDTRGTGSLNHVFHEYAPYKGPITGRKNGVLIALETSETVAYSLWNLQDRGTLFVVPGTKVYEGMIIGQHAKENDLVVNACRGKKLSNVRSSGTDEAVRLIPPNILTLEQALEYIADDELVEVTPESIRLRKKFLDPNERKRSEKTKK
jgi:GTP-binding protein